MQYRTNLGCLWLVLFAALIGGTPLLVNLLRFFTAFVVLTIVAGVALTWWVRRNAVLQYTRTRGARSKRFVELLVGLMVRLSEADGELDRREVTAIRQFFEHGLGYGGEQLLWIRDLIKAARRTNESVSDLCRELREKFGLQERMIVLQVLARIAEADGAMTQQERTFILQVAQRLGLAAFAGAFGRAGFESAYGSAGGRSSGARPAAPDGRGTVDGAFSELGLSRDASAAEIKQTWRKLSLENHPDRVAHLGEEFRKLAEERMRRINAAYDVLKQTGFAS